ncbi:ARABIDOPSIS FASCICLIN-LIKE ARABINOGALACTAN-PROTEIN 11, FASCICLIN-like arabinogalactan-protein 11 [Hibiscus trionum]|uniref:ARABIDOPSIS FASCICLIN-LIKE ARABINOGALACTAN-PROTEIN 11, FASCICLIN-like arabinogalactan-protein 11 n=1 Tax=Hibiscus trionum TaxID=183268 RepID=A0A9W7HKZ5_HIBTR|nr:ARABIDOPSIS FASCICLIN-LIKE ARABINOGALACTAN-PROTEIN 11, FASCICLIN-like arabinogalactan-protein 11 [Hibiscus trionum]
MRKQLVFIFVFMLIFFLCHETLAQIAPAPPLKVDNITSILEKGGQFTTFIKLLKATQVADQLNNELSTPNPNDGLTIFAPSDNAFSGLKPGTLNSLSDQEKLSLVQFHILPTLMSTTQFQTASNPLRTQAGDVKSGNFPLNVTASAGNQVNLTTGVVNATVANTVYSDRRIAVYQVDKVLLPLQIFGTAPVPAPAPDVADKDVSVSSPKASKGADTDSSGAVSLKFHHPAMASFGIAVFGTIFWGL